MTLRSSATARQSDMQKWMDCGTEERNKKAWEEIHRLNKQYETKRAEEIAAYRPTLKERLSIWLMQIAMWFLTMVDSDVLFINTFMITLMTQKFVLIAAWWIMFLSSVSGPCETSAICSTLLTGDLLALLTNMSSILTKKFILQTLAVCALADLAPPHVCN